MVVTSWNEPLTPQRGVVNRLFWWIFAQLGKTFRQMGFLPNPPFSCPALLKYLANILKAIGLCFNGCLADYCIGNLLHICRLCVCALRVRWILGHARASQERGQLQLMFGCRYSCSARSKELCPML